MNAPAPPQSNHRGRLAWLNKPLFGTKVIPPDARVDPARFPEDEFPLYCPKCDYLLRGLAEDRCPECGKSFDRGRLLVVNYVQDPFRRTWRHTRIGRALLWGAAGGFILTFLPAVIY